MKVLLAIEGGFSKTLFEGNKKAVEDFLKGFQYARNKNLQSPEVIGILKHMQSLVETPAYVAWATGGLCAMENTTGKLEVVE